MLQGVVGVWALLAPASFYRSFPISGHPWVSLLPPYNEHLTRDVGELSLALTVVLTAAAVTGQRLLSAVAVGALPCTSCRMRSSTALHLEGFTCGGRQSPRRVGIVLQLVVVAVVGWLLWRDRPRNA